MRASLLLTALALSLSVATSARAQLDDPLAVPVADVVPPGEIDPLTHESCTTMERRLEDVEARLDAVESSPLAPHSLHEPWSEGWFSPESSDSYWCNPCRGITCDTQLLFLRAHDSEASDSGTEFDPASRYELGYMNCFGRSWRARYFEYDTRTQADDSVVGMEMLDMEYAGRFAIGGNWRGELSGGLRWAEYDETGDLAYSDSIGPIVGAQLRGPSWRGFESLMNVRQSFQFGDAHNAGTAANFGSFGVSEIQMGLEYHSDLFGGTSFLRGLFETQFWNGVHESDSQSLGLIGLGVAAGLTR